MKKAKLLHARNFRSLIEKAIKELRGGEYRLAVSDLPLKYACLSGFSTPDITEWLASDYGVRSGEKDIEADYFEEIILLEKLMKDANVPINLTNWQRGAKTRSTKAMYEGLNRRAFAMELWDWYSIPWRYKNNAIHVIWTPRDVMGSPTIHNYPVGFFLVSLSSILEDQAENRTRILKRLGLWRNFGIVAIIVFVIFLWVKFLN